MSTSLHNNSWLNNSSLRGKIADETYSEINTFQTPPKFNNSGFIMNRSAMDQYLKDVSQDEKDISSAIDAQKRITGFIGSNYSSFWGNCRFDEIVASLKTSFYQLSPHTNKQNSLEESYSSKDQENNSEIIRKMCANKLSNYTANLKMVSSSLILINPIHNYFVMLLVDFENDSWTVSECNWWHW